MSWQRPNIGSRVNREVHARFWERPKVKVLRATRQDRQNSIEHNESGVHLLADIGADVDLRRRGPQPDSESAVDNAADPSPGGPWRIHSPETARRVAPPLSLLRHSGRSVYARARVTPWRTDMSTMRIMTAAALAAVFAVATASAQQPTTQR